MKEEDFSKIMAVALAELQKNAPNPKTRYLSYYTNAYGNRVKGSTGNHDFNACKSRIFGVGLGELYVDERIAPYMPYTTQPWLSPRWKGHENPNEKWWDKSVLSVAQKLAKVFGGKVYKTK